MKHSHSHRAEEILSLLVVSPGLQLIQTPSDPRISSIVSSSTFTKPMGYTPGTILLLKPHDPT